MRKELTTRGSNRLVGESGWESREASGGKPRRLCICLGCERNLIYDSTKPIRVKTMKNRFTCEWLDDVVVHTGSECIIGIRRMRSAGDHHDGQRLQLLIALRISIAS